MNLVIVAQVYSRNTTTRSELIIALLNPSGVSIIMSTSVEGADREDSVFICCIHHPGNGCDYYCQQCNQDVCRECISVAGEHADHQYQTKQIVAKEFRQSFEKELSDLLKKKETLKQQEESLIRHKTLVEQNCEKACEKISEAYDDVIQVAEQKRKDDIKGFREKYESDVGIKELRTLSNYVSDLHEEVLSIERRERQHDNSSNDILFMESRKEIDCEIKKTNTLLDQQLSEFAPHKPKPVGKTTILGSGLAEAVGEKVSAMYKFVDPQKTSVQVSGEMIHVDERSSVIVILKDSDGNPCLVPQEIHVQLQSNRNRAPIEANVDVHSSSEYIGEYTPTLLTRGCCQLKVWLDTDCIHEQTIHVECPDFIEKPCKVLDKVNVPGCLHKIGTKIFFIQGYDGERQIIFFDTTCLMSDICAKRSVFTAPKKYQNWRPIEMASSENCVYVTDSKYNMVHMFTNAGECIKSAGGSGGKKGKFKGPNGLCVTSDCIYVCDSFNDRIQVFDHELNFKWCFGSQGSGKGQFGWPSNVAFDERSSNVFVTELKNNRLQCLTERGDFICYIGSESGPGSLIEPNILLVANNYLYITDKKGVSIFKSSNEFVTRFATVCAGDKGKKSINGFAIDEDGYRYVSDDVHDRIVVF